MINKYYINIQMEETNNAGSKAVNDCNEIFRRNGIEPYTLKIKNSGNKYLIKLNKFLEFQKIKRQPFLMGQPQQTSTIAGINAVKRQCCPDQAGRACEPCRAGGVPHRRWAIP